MGRRGGRGRQQLGRNAELGHPHLNELEQVRQVHGPADAHVAQQRGGGLVAIADGRIDGTGGQVLDDKGQQVQEFLPLGHAVFGTVHPLLAYLRAACTVQATNIRVCKL
jgi:hypothetical protein